MKYFSWDIEKNEKLKAQGHKALFERR